MRGLILPALDRRLRPRSTAPLAVAFSGGGDSLALLLLARDWALAHDRSLLVLTVDHGLNPASAGWTRRCAETAAILGLDFRALHWTGDKPATGLPSAARAARHALLADAARDAGARVVMMGHTADDTLEAAAMRAEGSTVSDPTEWGPSPAWPEGRDIFLLRPMLHLRRSDIRDWLTARGEGWIDDPANEDPRSARARARARTQQSSPLASPLAGRGTGGASGGAAPRSDVQTPGTPAASASPPRSAWSPSPHGGGLGLLRTAAASAIAAACLCAGGTVRPPRGDRLERLVGLVRSGESFTATLAGARIEADGDTVIFTRNVGEASRGGLAPITLIQGRPTVWDGRYEVTVSASGLTVTALSGLTRQIPKAEQQALRAIPASVRPSLPVILGGDVPTCPILADRPSVLVRELVLTRFEAATGDVDSEPGV